MAIYDNGLNPALPNYDAAKSVAASSNTNYNSAQGVNSPPPPNAPNAPNVPTPQVAGDATTNLASTQTNYLDTVKNTPSSYDMYLKELKSRGIDTLSKQQQEIGQSALEQEKALRPLLPENVQFKFPKSLQQLQDVGVNQDQLNLLAAKERAPIAQALSDLLKSQSLIAQRIDQQVELSKYATQLKADDYQRKTQAAELQYNFAKEVADGSALKQQEAKNFALENNITQPYYNIGGTVYRAADGYAFTSEQDFQTQTNLPVSQAQSQGLIQAASDIGQPAKPASTDIAEYEYAQAQGYEGSFMDFVAKSAASKRAPSNKKAPPSNKSDFSVTQLAKGAAAAGMSIDDFADLEADEQNYYINGQGSDLEDGRIGEKDFQEFQDTIDEEIDNGTGLGEIRDLIDNSDLPQQDKEDLKQYAEDQSNDGFQWYNPLSWF